MSKFNLKTRAMQVCDVSSANCLAGRCGCQKRVDAMRAALQAVEDQIEEAICLERSEWAEGMGAAKRIVRRLRGDGSSTG